MILKAFSPLTRWLGKFSLLMKNYPKDRLPQKRIKEAIMNTIDSNSE